MKLTRITALLAFAAASFTVAGCKDTLDKMDLTAANEELVFQNETTAFLYLSYIYEQNLPSWFGQSNLGIGTTNPSILSEEVAGDSKYLAGTIAQNDVQDIGIAVGPNTNYGKIRTINMFIQGIGRSPIPMQPRNQLKGEALFFRAYRYFDLVRVYGGVPLVLTPLGAVGDEARAEAFVPRNSTTECFNQIATDLDSAISYLPGRWTGNNTWGRITKGAAAAFKARVLLYAASPQFNPGDDAAKWARAFAASQQAQTLLTANGFRLNASYDQLWFEEENNVEAVLVTNYNTTANGTQNAKNNQYDNATRPSYTGTGGGSNRPTWDLVKAYPMLDGKKPGESTKYPYNLQQFYKNRDPRFDKTIAYNGATWPLNGNTNYKLWTYLRGTTTVEATSNPTPTSFYLRKAINPTTPASNVINVGTNWIEIRYAEVLLNLAEAACGVGNLTEAYTQLKAIRQRAGIEAGDGNYGLQAGMSRDQMFEAILYERQIELAFEGKRFWDLRRWKKMESTLNNKRREGLTITLKTTGVPADFATTRDNLNIDQVYANYFTIATRVLDTNGSFPRAIDWQPSYYFFAIPQQAIDNNPQLVQNNTWNGAFNPLQ
ncbi:RagB/SusD family nutrient uptake outer membrane protein [Hymenobacter jeollabukensis]|uniref:RagB/SusD family nutrient uptake outer membrane protein n=1 Tax=Hymenobacter jeollabukensis TaxID=2025313 RepID=A0A5R8WLT4_9BACT|nr:RagB/SusD family nutrient uptake outer membrane protein [Hymenobacter jeollabukensis]TLM89775.1 RagB/SusD family nutrient uptake outer membrane protein [Hymenobacter jeollabukensis]